MKNKLETIYASWLGKCIGIRLGAPVENWHHRDIVATYGEIKGYVCDYQPMFAADDDSNGPLFFVRALLNKEEISAEMLGNHLLNMLSDGHGFFWWGGEGVSTEHTAYNRLKSGIKAPQSGSISTLGITLAEQIGGQIFSDCWGYVSLGDASLAKRLAGLMSSVTHDGSGIVGGEFVAVCIALAFSCDDVHELLNEALTYFSDGDYIHCVKDIMTFYKENPYDSKACLEYILEKYDYSCYEGMCHIIPNTAIMIYAMVYGENNFKKTMLLLVNAGWDTDCTLGNVGSIMGALCGIDGIDHDLIIPLHDVVLCSSFLGSLNIQSISQSAQLFYDVGRMLKGESVINDDALWFDFKLPYGVCGFKSKSYRYSETSLVVADNKLRVVVNQGFKGFSGMVYVTTYYLPSDLYDARYEPSFSPLVYPGEKVTWRINNNGLPIEFKLAVEYSDGSMTEGETFVVDGVMDVSYVIERSSKTVVKLCLIPTYLSRIMHGVFMIEHVRVDRTFDYILDFKTLKRLDYGLTFSDTPFSEVETATSLRNKCTIIDGSLCVCDDFIVFGDSLGVVGELEGTFKTTCSFGFCFDIQGTNKYRELFVEKNKLSYRVFNNGLVYCEEIGCVKISEFEEFTLKLHRNYGTIIARLDDREMTLLVDQCFDYYGSIGIKTYEVGCVYSNQITVKALSRRLLEEERT